MDGQHALPLVGNTNAICPYCGQQLDKMPSRKKDCPHCRQPMFVRTRPGDGQRVIVTVGQADQIEEQWSIVNGMHASYLAKKKRFLETKACLAKRFGREPSDNDIAWSLFNDDMLTYASKRQWGFFRNAKLGMAEILRKESQFKQALVAYLEICYIDLNGPSNIGNVPDPEILKEYPPWDYKNLGMLAPGIIERIAKIIKKICIPQDDVKVMFFKQATEIKERLCLPVPVTKAWENLSKELF